MTIAVPERIYDINEPDADSKKANLVQLSISEEDAWWNQVPLENLDLSSNALSHISPKIENLLTLTVLQLHDNALVALPPEIGKLEKLVRLNLGHNKLSELPIELFSLPELRHLNISHNEFIELNPDISNLHMLEFLVRRWSKPKQNIDYDSSQFSGLSLISDRFHTLLKPRLICFWATSLV